MSKVWVLVRKEIRELLRERIVLFGLLLGPLLMYAVMGGVASASFSQVSQQAAYKPRIAIVTSDTWKPGNITRALAEALGSPIYTVVDPETLLGKGYDAVLVIPSGFDEDLLRGVRATATLIYKPRTLSYAELSKPDQITGIVDSIVKSIVAESLKKYMPSITPEFLSSPVQFNTQFYYKGETVSSQQLMGLVMGVSIALPLAVLMTAIASTQVAAISFGLEKEAKTLEKLFTLPVSRRSLLLGKLIAVTVLAIGGVASYMLGLYIYMKMIMNVAATGGGEAPTSIVLPGRILGLLALGLALTLYTNIVIGFIIGSQAGDVRSSQMAASYISFILAIPLFPMFMGLDLTQLPATVKAAISIDPYALLAMFVSAGITEKHTIIALSGLGLVIHGIAWTLIAARLLSPETMIVGHPLLKRISKYMAERRRRSPSTI
ncbi:MAG: ABC transporter permease [Desulfurococcales archaeon]|nr:ABC transporter permease [Desulfurococcales archaeon]